MAAGGQDVPTEATPVPLLAVGVPPPSLPPPTEIVTQQTTTLSAPHSEDAWNLVNMGNPRD